MLATVLTLSVVFQSSTPVAPLSPEQSADIALAAPRLAPTIETIGACETLFPELGPHMSAMVNAPSEDAESAAMREYVRQAYERGKASPQTRTVTAEACQAALTSLQGQITELAAAEEQLAQVDQALAGVSRMFRILGKCERVLPPEAASAMTEFQRQSGPENRAATEMLLAAYEAGKTSPEAASVTLDQCMQDLEAVQADMQTLVTEMETSTSGE